MKIYSSGIINGYIESRFGKFCDESDKLQDVSIRSLPISWGELPAGTTTLALVMEDYDAVPVCGFSWIHWLVANIDPNRKELLENASREDKELVQGKNSRASKQISGEQPDSIVNYYLGPRPPDKDHEYKICVYALDAKLNLQTGFMLNDLMKAMRGHVLDSADLYGLYRA